MLGEALEQRFYHGEASLVVIFAKNVRKASSELAQALLIRSVMTQVEFLANLQVPSGLSNGIFTGNFGKPCSRIAQIAPDGLSRGNELERGIVSAAPRQQLQTWVTTIQAGWARNNPTVPTGRSSKRKIS